MKKWMIGVVVIAVVAVGAFLVFGGELSPLSASEPTPEAEAARGPFLRDAGGRARQRVAA